jgi:nicotinate-nucleotide pyrophosphorylase (carboxylating)
MLLEEVDYALREDIGTGDITAELIDPKAVIEAKIHTREALVMCGQAWAQAVFTRVDPSIQVMWLVAEGTYLSEPGVLATITGPARGVLTAERTALNFLQTLSGTATLTRQYVECLRGTGVTLLDTRKTLPGLRQAQKYAVRCGGGVNHRVGLYDAFLIKENHIKAYGSVQAVISKARALYPERFLEIEVQTLDELEQALHALPDRILLDNFDTPSLCAAVAMNQPKRVPLEVSGGVSLANINAIAATGIDCISVGSLTKSVRAIDLSLLVERVI